MALFAILLQALLPLIHHPAEAAPIPAGIHICSFSHHSNGTNGSDKTPASKPQCPLCFSLHLLGGGYVPPETSEIAVAFRDGYVVIAQSDEFVIRPFVWPGIGSRAPPVFA